VDAVQSTATPPPRSAELPSRRLAATRRRRGWPPIQRPPPSPPATLSRSTTPRTVGAEVASTAMPAPYAAAPFATVRSATTER
jgi:hypothetical protein